MTSRPRLAVVDLPRELEGQTAALEALRKQVAAGHLTVEEIDARLVDIAVAQFGHFPASIVEELRRTLNDLIETDPYFVAAREQWRTQRE